MSENEKTELKFLGGLFRNESKKGDIYYSGKSEDGQQWVLFRNAYWKEAKQISLTLDSTLEFLLVPAQQVRTDGL